MFLFASAAAANETAAIQDQNFYLLQADSALREGRLTQADQMITWLSENASEVARDDVALLRAELSIARHDVAAAVAALAGIENAERNACRIEAAKGWLANARMEFDGAIISLAKVTQDCPDDAGSWNLLGIAFMQKGETAAALAAFRMAAELEPSNANIISNTALVLVQKGDLPLAMAGLDRAAMIAPDNLAIAANRDYVSGMLGLVPERRADENDSIWSIRLINVAMGAKAASKVPYATALFSRALLTLDRFDESLWSETGFAIESPR